MTQPTPQFNDFLLYLNDDQKNFAITINDKLLQEGCKVKITTSKTTLFSVKYTEGRRWLVTFSLRKKGLKVSIYAKNYANYPEVLNTLPPNLQSQIINAPDCKNLVGPKKCSWADCIGYSIPIGGNIHQKCYYQCFQFDVDAESIPSLLGLLDSELKERRAA